MSELPMGWERMSLADVAEVRLGRQRSPRRATGDRMRPYLRAANITWKGLDLSDVKEMDFTEVESVTYELHPGDLLLSEASGSPGEVGKPAQYRGEIEGCCFQNTLLRVRLPIGLSPEFYGHFFSEQARNGRFAAGSRGVGIRHLGASALSDWQVPVPPVAEQERIVEAVEEASSRLDAGEAGLRAIRQLVKRLRVAVLSAAVTGRLVPQELTDTPAAKLLADLGVDPIEPEDVPDLPPRWAWVSLGSVADVVGGVTKDSKRDTDLRFVERPYLRVANVQRGYLDLTQVTTIRVAEERATRLELRPGDVLFNEGGDRDKLGRGWIWEGQVPGCIHQNHVFRARLGAGIEPRLVSIWGNTFGRGWFEAHGRQTTNLASINLRTLKSFPIPVASVEEQTRIVAELERQVSFLDACERAVDAGFERSKALRRSVLKAAFEGKLVPQDPSDDPASVLLERIRAEEAASPKPTRRTRRTA